MLVLIFFSFLAGVATILSPCILPILPIILSTSLTGGKKRPFGIVIGFILSFSFFTLALTTIVRGTGIPSDSLRVVAVIILLLFGISMLLPQMQILLEKLFSKLSSLTPQNTESSGFGGGIIVGLSLGLLWTPCVGPIMASVLTLAATSSVTLQAVFITLAYSLGTAIPMFFIIYGGRKILDKVPFLLKNTAKIQKIFGVVVILLAVGIHYNWDRKFQSYILDKFPNYGAGITSLEDIDIVKESLKDTDMMKDDSDESTSGDLACKTDYGAATGFESGGEWLNSEPLMLEELKGKVVLVDFWTYTCINCIRTLPYLNAWHEKYADDGLVIIGVHTPEFEFEKSKTNLEEAIADYEIKYPVVQDNDYKIWREYENRYWPAKYFVDKDGCIRWEHFGEGNYDESEKLIQELLAETGREMDEELVDVPEFQGSDRTPETYLGFARIDRFSSPEKVTENEITTYSIPSTLKIDNFAYGGEWLISEEYSRSSNGSTLELQFLGKDVYLVMKAAEEADVKVSLDGTAVNTENAGEDVSDGTVTVNSDRLYHLLELENYREGRLKLEFTGEIEVFAFTFG